MRLILHILIFLISTNSFCQSSNDKKYKLINELIRDNYYDKIVRLDSLPCNDKFIIDGSYVQQNRELINASLTENEITDFLTFCDSSRCFLPAVKLEQTIKLCDSTSIHITDLDNRLNINRYRKNTSFKWHPEKIITKTKGKEYYDLSFSEPLINDKETIMIIHIISFIGNQDIRGKTILFKKINSKWTRICVLHAWIT